MLEIYEKESQDEDVRESDLARIVSQLTSSTNIVKREETQE